MIVIVMLFDSDFGLHYVSLLLRRAAEQDRVSSIRVGISPSQTASVSSAFHQHLVLPLFSSWIYPLDFLLHTVVQLFSSF